MRARPLVPNVAVPRGDHGAVQRGAVRRGAAAGWVFLLLVVTAVLAQTDAKPATAPREPERPTAGTMVVVQVECANSVAPGAGEMPPGRGRPPEAFAAALPNLVRYLAKVPGLELPVQVSRGPLDGRAVAGAGLLYWTGCAGLPPLSEAEKRGLGRYLVAGGLLFADDIRASTPEYGLDGTDAGVAGTPFDRQLKALIADPLVLGAAGGQWEPVPVNHAVYHSFFDFPDGPPRGGAPSGRTLSLEMLQVRGRPAIIFSDLNLSWYWGDPFAGTRERGLQFGVNLLVLARSQQLKP